MSRYQEDPVSPESPADAAADRAVAKTQAAASRRRWLTLAEVVAIAGVVIAALTLWNNWQGRRADQVAAHAQQENAEAAAQAQSVVTLHATPADDGQRLALSDPDHTIQSVDVSFPSELGVPAQTSTLAPSIEAAWFAKPLLTILEQGRDDQSGRVPVVIASDYWDGERHVTDRAVYDIIWQTHGRLLRGRDLELKGIVLDQRKGATQATIDRLWVKRAPAVATDR